MLTNTKLAYLLRQASGLSQDAVVDGMTQSEILNSVVDRLEALQEQCDEMREAEDWLSNQELLPRSAPASTTTMLLELAQSQAQQLQDIERPIERARFVLAAFDTVPGDTANVIETLTECLIRSAPENARYAAVARYVDCYDGIPSDAIKDLERMGLLAINKAGM